MRTRLKSFKILMWNTKCHPFLQVVSTLVSRSGARAMQTGACCEPAACFHRLEERMVKHPLEPIFPVQNPFLQWKWNGAVRKTDKGRWKRGTFFKISPLESHRAKKVIWALNEASVSKKSQVSFFSIPLICLLIEYWIWSDCLMLNGLQLNHSLLNVSLQFENTDYIFPDRAFTTLVSSLKRASSSEKPCLFWLWNTLEWDGLRSDFVLHTQVTDSHLSLLFLLEIRDGNRRRERGKNKKLYFFSPPSSNHSSTSVLTLFDQKDLPTSS